MTKLAETQRPKWKERTPKQRLSNRTVLRIQAISKELCNDLNALPSFVLKKRVEKVLFVSCDTNYPPKKHIRDRFYNSRLLDTFQFTEENNAVWDWISKERNIARFEMLFAAAAAAAEGKSRFILFEEAVRNSEKEKAHDLLIDAVAVIPYRGLLLSLFDEFFFGGKGEKIWNCCWVELEGKTAMINAFDEFRIKNRVLKREIGGIKFKRKKKKLAALFENFIDPFMIGKRPVAKPRKNSPYYSDAAGTSAEKLRGFVLPIYDFHPAQATPCGCGGFVGWVMAVMANDFMPSRDKSDDLQQSWERLGLVTRSFARRVREEQMRELVEEEWGDSVNAADFTLKHYKHYGGWKEEDRRGDSDACSIPKDELFIFCKLDHKQFKAIDSEKFGRREQITQIRVDLSEQLEVNGSLVSEPIVKAFQKRLDSILPDKNEDLRHYGESVALSIRDLYEAAQLRQAEKQAGATENRRTQEFRLAHETRTMAGALVRGDQSIIRDTFGRQLVSLSYPADGEKDRKTERNDLNSEWPAPYAIEAGPVIGWLKSIVTTAARMAKLGEEAPNVVALGKTLETILNRFIEEEMKTFSFSDQLSGYSLNPYFPNPARKFLVRAWLAAIGNYFKHRLRTQVVGPPCTFKIDPTPSTDVWLLSFSNQCSPDFELVGSKIGTKTLLLDDIMNTFRWRNPERGKSFHDAGVFGRAGEQAVRSHILFNPQPLRTDAAKRIFITQLPMPSMFFSHRRTR